MIKKLLLVSALILPATSYADEQAHFEAARAVISMPQGDKLEEMVQGIVNQQAYANPNIKPIRKAFETFYREVFQSEEFIDGLAQVQMELFTYEELLEIKEMMKLPIFKKYEEVMPQFLAKNMEVGQKLVMARQDRLMELINLEHKKIEQLQELDEHMNLTGSQ